MGLWQCVSVCVWLAGLEIIETAPRPDGTKASAPGAEESQLFLDRTDFFDYPDSDEASLLAVAQFIGERPVVFKTGSGPGLFHHFLVSALTVAFFWLLFQLCTHM
uniref:fertilization-influencing membrane protein n=1 Tax=Jaculus jaculus TaxID=51337 RepID=UPI001E1B253A|nr:fertilization-influencing membrane protein [Jaculus jaculus]